MIGFLLVVAGTIIAALCVGAGQGGRRRLLILGGVFAAWLILPSIILQAHWGYYHESGGAMGYSYLGDVHSSNQPAQEAVRFATEICGDAEGFNVGNDSVYYTAMDEHEDRKHFFYYSKYSDTSWVGIGRGDRYCLARYHISMRQDGELVWFPTRFFPFPFFPWISYSHIVDVRLIERVPAPKSPEGVRALLPAQCAWGEVPKGESRDFQVEMPSFVRQVELVTHFLCYDVYDDKFERSFDWSRDGRPLGRTKTTHGGGLYRVTLHASGEEALGYQVAIASPEGSCPSAKSWEKACEWNRDPNHPGRLIPTRVKGPRPAAQDDN